MINRFPTFDAVNFALIEKHGMHTNHPGQDQLPNPGHEKTFILPLYGPDNWAWGHACSIHIKHHQNIYDSERSFTWEIVDFCLIPTNLITPEFVAYREERAKLGFYLYIEDYSNPHVKAYRRDDQGTMEVFAGVELPVPTPVDESKLIFCKDRHDSSYEDPGIAGFVAVREAALAAGYTEYDKNQNTWFPVGK